MLLKSHLPSSMMSHLKEPPSCLLSHSTHARLEHFVGHQTYKPVIVSSIHTEDNFTFFMETF